MNFIVTLILLAFFFFGALVPFYLWIEERFRKFKYPREYKRQKEIIDLRRKLSTIQRRKNSVEWYSSSEGILDSGRKEMEAVHREERKIKRRLRELDYENEAI